MIADDGTAKLADFGIAQPEGATRLTSTGLVVGTRSYLAPEVARGEPATVRSDLYSCGMVLREAIGDQPSAALAELVTRLVDQDPARRPESASQALATLATPRRAARSETTAPTQPVAPERAITVGARAGQRGLPRPVVGMAILAVAIVLGLILLSGGDNRSSTGAGPASDRVGQEDRQQAPAEAQPEGAPAEPSKGKPKGKKPPKKTPPGKAKGRNKH